MMNRFIIILFVLISIVIGNENDNELDIINIDMESFMNGDNNVRQNIASMIDYAMREYGTFGVINHNINDKLIDAMFKNSEAFFESDIEYKMSYLKDYGNLHGYTPVGNESYFNSEINDTKYGYCESFQAYNDGTSNLETERIPKELTPTFEEYWYQSKVLITNLHKMITMAMKCEHTDDIFASYMTNGFVSLRVNYYPPISSANNTHSRLSDHRDFCGFGLLKANHPGLEIYSQKLGKWLPIKEHKDNNILVIPGEFIENWTNGQYKSPLHRVVSYKENVNSNDVRISFASFSGPHVESMIDILPCQINSNINKRIHEPIMAIDQINKRMKDWYNFELETDPNIVDSKQEL